MLVYFMKSTYTSEIAWQFLKQNETSSFADAVHEILKIQFDHCPCMYLNICMYVCMNVTP